MKIDTKSMHYRLFKEYARGDVYELKCGILNFCQYSRRVFLGVIMALVMVLLGVFLASGPFQFLGSLVLWAVTDNPLMWFIEPLNIEEGGSLLNIAGMMMITAAAFEILLGIAFVAVAGGGTVVGWAVDRVHKLRQDKGVVEYKEPGFLATWYRSKKDKFCPLVTVEQEDVKPFPAYRDPDDML